MANRHALLIGVPRYDRDEFNDPRLEAAVHRDLNAMRSALEQSDYKITECGPGGPVAGVASLNHVNEAIEEACANVPDDGVLLVYFSGHGITEAGTDYLVPSDAFLARGDRASGRPAQRSLLSAVPPHDVLRDCRARLMVVFADACRNGSAVGGPAGAGQPAEPGGQLPFLANGGHFVMVTGCGAGQVGQYDETGSVFTRALANALDTRNPARTLAEVVTATRLEMERRSRSLPDSAQLPAVRYPEMLTLAGDVRVCDGDELTEAWRKAVDASPLLAQCDDPDRVRAVVDDCARRCRSALQNLKDRRGLADPWTDQDYPARVLQNAERLLRNGGLLGPAAVGDPAAGLRSGEAALLLTAPFLREAVLAVGLREAAAIHPADLTRTYDTGPRGDLELTHEMHQHIVRRAAGLRRRAEEQPGSEAGQASDQLAMWLVHRWLADRGALWHEAEATEICARAAGLVGGCRGSADPAEMPMLISALLLAIGADPDDGQLLKRLNSGYVSDRWRMIAALLWLAGIMAADLRRLPPVVADLVGTGMNLPLTDVRTAASTGAEWVLANDDTLDLRLVCGHPALHDVFEDIVRRAVDAVRTIKAELGLPADLGHHLPRGFTVPPSGLRPATRPNEAPAYEVPLARFQVAEEKVRELLMGRQLYGEPALAIRELYQNALDACRWRKTRQQYLEQTNQSPAPWTGVIRFTQGTGADGRPYIDCEDNGVGMDRNTLEHVFGNAGERFVYQQEFRTEQASWAELDPPLQMISNSQFGVGVFSYFMLADEITVRTRHQAPSGIPNQDAHKVTIASSGSLFLIEPTPGLGSGGTCVRLYLSGEATDISVLRTLRELLWISEFRVEVSEGEDREVWEPERLRYPEATVEPCQYGEDLWWVSGDGGLAADGIRTDQDTFGLVINLRDKRRPRFTVDRRSLEGWDKDWVRTRIHESLPELMEWEGFTLSWLWQVAESDPAIAQQIFDHAVAVRHDVRIGTAWGQSAVALHAVGCLPDDRTIFERENLYLGDWFARWRVGVWRRLVAIQAHAWWARPAEQTVGFPVPDPTDASLITKLSSFNSDDLPSRDKILVALARNDRTIATMLRRLRAYAITGFNLADTRYVPAAEITVKDDDAELLGALAAWSLPGEDEGRSSVGPLVRASSRLDLPLGEVIRRASSLAPAGWVAPSYDLSKLRHHTCSEAEATLLARNFTRYSPEWFYGEFTPAHLVKASNELGRPLSSILKMCDELAGLGVRVARRDAYPEDLEVVEFYALHYADQPGQALTPLQIVVIAGRAGMSVGDAYVALARLEESGLIVRPDLKGDPGFTPGEAHLSLIDSELRGSYGRFVADRKLLRRPFLRIVSRIMGRAGYETKMAARDLVPLTVPETAVTAAELAELASLLDTSLGDAAKKLSEVYPAALLPQLDRGCSDLRVDYALHDALLTSNGDDAEWQLSPASIVGDALWLRAPLGDFLRELDQFRMLGAPVPAFDETILENLNHFELDEYDRTMLSDHDDLGDRRQVEAITPLALVRIAGRIGWSVANAHGRLARLVPIGVKLDYPADVPLPGEVVYWYDLLALTMYFNGQEPAICGRIDWPYLERAAVEIFDCAIGEVPEKAAFLRDRLRRYAPLFQLELPEEAVSA